MLYTFKSANGTTEVWKSAINSTLECCNAPMNSFPVRAFRSSPDLATLLALSMSSLSRL